MSTAPKRLPVERVIPEETGLSAPEADAVLEVAYLMTAADGSLADEEVVAFARVAARLRKTAGQAGYRDAPAPRPDLTRKELDALLDKLAEDLAHKSPKEAVEKAAAALPAAESRELAYKIAFAMSLADLDAGGEEESFEVALLSALGISEERAEALEDEVYATLEGEGG